MQTTKKQKIQIIAATLLILLTLVVYTILKIATSANIVSAGEFEKILKNSQVKELYLKDNYIYAITKNSEYKSAIDGLNLKELYNKYPIRVYPKTKNYLTYIAILLLFSILIAIIVILKRSNNNPNSIMYQKDKDELLENKIEPTVCSNITFKDIAGVSDVKDELEDIVDSIKNRAKYIRRGIKVPKGLLLVGPPGVGKTLIAKAISSEAAVPFFYHSGANFVQIYAGMGAKRVKELFNKAKEMAPSIIFIDEIDAVGKSRDKLNSDEREATLNQLLVEMDGFEENLGVLVIGATNRVDILDSALLRPGRFDRRVFIDLPNISEREQIIKHYLEGKSYSFDIKEVAKITTGFSPASIEVLINEATLYSFKKGKNEIDLNDILKVKDRVIYGKKRVKILNEKEKEIEANYKVAKAVIASWLGFDFDRVNLLHPFDIKDEKLIKSKKYFENLMPIYMAGTIYLYKKYRDIFLIGKEDRLRVREIIKNSYDDFALIEIGFFEMEDEHIPYDITIDTKKILSDLNSLLDSLKSVIEELSLELIKKESLSYKDIKKRLNEVF